MFCTSHNELSNFRKHEMQGDSKYPKYLLKKNIFGHYTPSIDTCNNDISQVHNIHPNEGKIGEWNPLSSVINFSYS